MGKRGSWRTRFGFYLIAIGSAFGLGNLWRFPYVVGENGGGAFILLYTLLALVIGMPLLIAELIFGKATRQSVLLATKEVSTHHGNYFKWAGRWSVVLSLVVLSYYSVISGWVLHFITQYFIGFFSVAHSYTNSLKILMENGALQWALASVHILITLIVVAKGVQEGLEKWIISIMPLFAFLMIVLVSQTLSLPSSSEVLRFLFYPDFSKLTLSSLNHAIGHVFFTLSVGFGTMVTFGSYMKEEDHVPTAGFRVSVVDTMVSLFAGLLIFPIAFHVSDLPLKDPALLFEALPKFLVQTRWGEFFGFLFFLSLYFAALNASISLLETIVSNLMDISKLKIKRTKAAWFTGAAALALAFFPALSSTMFKNLHWADRSLIEILDSVLINWLLPVVALFLCWTINKGMSDREKSHYFIKNDIFVSFSMYSHWLFVIRWVAPATIILGLFLQFLGLL